MLISKRRGWELPESAATPEHLFHQRRRLIQGLAAGPILLAGGGLGWRAAAAEDADPTADLYPGPAQSALPARPTHPRAQRREAGHHLQQLLRVRLAQADLEGGAGARAPARGPSPSTAWSSRSRRSTSTICSGRCRSRSASTATAASRRGRWPCRGAASRCAALVDLARPLGSAKYLRMETFLDPEMAPGQKQFWYPWPYVEGLTMAEATQRARLHRHRPVRQADRASRTARRCASRCRGNTASSRSSRSSASPSPTSAR